MSTTLVTRQADLPLDRGNVLLTTSYAPLSHDDPIQTRLMASAFRQAVLRAASTMFHQVDIATALHDELARPKNPIMLAAEHELGTISGELKLNAALCAAGVEEIKHSFTDKMPALVSHELQIAVRSPLTQPFLLATAVRVVHLR